MLLGIVFLLVTGVAAAQNVTELWLRGYSVVPSPRNVRLAAGDIVFDARWTVDDSRPAVMSAKAKPSVTTANHGPAGSTPKGARMPQSASKP